ncbi:hypothetical protein JCM11641_003151 [Rhodosporidiobolus odoratus]
MSAPAAPAALPAMDSSIGAFLVGTILSIFLAGITSVQVYEYYQNFGRTDRALLIGIVSFLLVCDLFHTAISCFTIYFWTVTNYANPAVLVVSPWSFTWDPFLTGIVSFTVQLFYAWRVFVVSKRQWILPACIGVLSLLQLAFAVGSTWEIYLLESKFSRFGEFRYGVATWLLAAAAADILITSSLIWYLRQASNILECTYAAAMSSPAVTMSHSQSSTRTNTAHIKSVLQYYKDAGGGFSVWDYTERLRTRFKTTSARPTWVAATAALYRITCDPDLVEPADPTLNLCAIKGYDPNGDFKLEGAHIQRQLGSTANVVLKNLINHKVIPPYAFHLAPVNLVQLSTGIHRDLDNERLDFLPTLPAVCARLACEVMYQDYRAQYNGEQAGQAPVRPPFDLFYSRLEAPLAEVQVLPRANYPSMYISRRIPHPERADLESITVYAFPRIKEDDRLRMSTCPTVPLFPHLLIPISTNILIWASFGRILRPPGGPGETDLEREILLAAVQLLLKFWNLGDGDEDKAKKVRDDAEDFLERQDPTYHQHIVQAKQSGAFGFDSVSQPTPAPNAVNSMGNVLSPSAPLLIADILGDDFDSDDSLSLASSEDSPRTPEGLGKSLRGSTPTAAEKVSGWMARESGIHGILAGEDRD